MQGQVTLAKSKEAEKERLNPLVLTNNNDEDYFFNITINNYYPLTYDAIVLRSRCGSWEIFILHFPTLLNSLVLFLRRALLISRLFGRFSSLTQLLKQTECAVSLDLILSLYCLAHI